jgi:outer membrane protein assembly factor BamB
VFQRPVVHDGVVYFGSRDGQLSAVRTGGGVVWQTGAGGPVVSGLAVSGDVLLAVTVNGRLSARRLSDGLEVWALYLTPKAVECKVYAPVRAADGTAFVAATILQGEHGYPALFRVPVG